MPKANSLTPIDYRRLNDARLQLEDISTRALQISNTGVYHILVLVQARIQQVMTDLFTMNVV